MRTIRLIDADTLCKIIESEFDGVCVYDVSGREAASDFCNIVDIAPTIDAIPVEWIKAHTDVIAIKAVLTMWQNEQNDTVL